jgi:hypothetical protein
MSEDFNHIDEIIRQKFDNFEPEPPAQAWEKIKSGISDKPVPPSAPGIILPIIVTISILIFLSGLIRHYYANPADNAAKQNTSLTLQAAGVISTGSTTTSDQTLQKEFYQTPAQLPVPKISQAPQESIPVRAPFNQEVKVKKSKKAAKAEVAASSAPVRPSGEYRPGLVQAMKSGQLSYSDVARYNLDARQAKKLSAFTSSYEKNNHHEWSIGAYFNPEVTSCSNESIENTISYNFGILPRISFNHFFVESGVNFRNSSDKGDVYVDYNRFLGTYEHVDYMTFDTINDLVVPTYHTHTQDVYDTVNHYAVTDTRINYTYLEIPLYVGYRHTFGKVSVFGKFGPSASFMMYKHSPDASPEEKARIVSTDSQVPVRSSVNWQLMMGAGIDYRLADRISISFEPTFRYGLTPEYDLGGSSNTSSFGIRAGINYILK